MSNLASYFDERLILFLEASNQKAALKQLIEPLYELKKIEDPVFFLEKVEAREKIVSTGVGFGVAIPHAKVSGTDEFFIALGILKKPLDWKAIDGHPVRLLFLIGGPDDKQNEYLQILSQITSLIKDENFRKNLLTLNSPTDIVNFLRSLLG